MTTPFRSEISAVDLDAVLDSIRESAHKLASLDFGTALIGEFAHQFLRYFVGAGLTFWIVWRGTRFAATKLPAPAVTAPQLRFEISRSVSTIAIFALFGAAIQALHRTYGVFRFYEDPREYGLIYWALSPVVFVALHDTYFYWTHRLMHHRRLFPLFHRVHHRSSATTPFTIYSFHPLEAMVEASFVPLAALVLPMHALPLFILLQAALAMNLVGHFGHELYGRSFWRSRWVGILTTTTHHHLHHRGGPHSNYGFYFRFWDRLCGTEDPRYADEIEARSR